MALDFTKKMWKGKPFTFVQGRIIVKVAPTRSGLPVTPVDVDDILDDIISDFGLGPKLTVIGTWAVIAAPGTDIPATVDLIAARTDVQYAEPDLAVKASSRFVPYDPYADPTHPDGLYDQWALETIGAYDAWCAQTGDCGILIGIVDSGIQMDATMVDPLAVGVNPATWMNHEDLEPTGRCGSRFTVGTDFVEQKELCQDFDGHGTEMTGIIAATADNGKGMAGLNWNSPVFINRALDGTATGGQSQVVECVREILDHAIANHMKAVINLSLGYQDDITHPADGIAVGTVIEICQMAQDAGAILCCASGNDEGGPVDYPARCSVLFTYLTDEYDFSDTVIAVGAMGLDPTTKVEKVMGSSNLGPQQTLVAPGDSIRTTTIGGGYVKKDFTSPATAHVTGVASLVWSQQPELTAGQVKQILIETAVRPVTVAAFPDDSWGYGVLNARAAVNSSLWWAEATQLEIRFVDVPEGSTERRPIEVSVKSCTEMHFVVVVNGDSFGIQSGTYTHPAGPDTSTTTVFNTLEAIYTASAANPTPSGSVHVSLQETGDSWEFEISANMLVVPPVMTMLVVDCSKSMDQPSGIPNLQRIDLMKESTGTLIDLLPVNDGFGAVAFNDSTVVVTDVDPPPNPPTVLVTNPPPRPALKAGIKALIPNGLTGIATGVEKAIDTLNDTTDNVASTFAKKAIIVLTDGKENHGKLIAELMEEGPLGVPVYAIGMGKLEVLQPAPLIALTAATGGYMVVADDVAGDRNALVSKYYAQILSNIESGGVGIFDPTYRIRPGRPRAVTVDIARAEQRIDVIAFVPTSGIVDISLKTPGLIPETIDESTTGVRGISFEDGSNVSYCRANLPIELADQTTAHEGKWRVVLAVNQTRFDRYVNTLKAAGEDTTAIETHGVPCTLAIQGRSDLRMACRVYQNSFEPGAEIKIHAILNHSGVSLQAPHEVEALVRNPDGTHALLRLAPSGRKAFKGAFTADIPGVYECRVMATGFSLDGDRFHREQTVTGVVWQGGDSP